jgi:hypothetical protein
MIMQEEAVAGGLLWCSQSDAAAACNARTLTERRKRGQRYVSRLAGCPDLDWSAVGPVESPRHAE